MPHLSHFLLGRIGRQRHGKRVGRYESQDHEDQNRDDKKRGNGNHKTAVDDAEGRSDHCNGYAFNVSLCGRIRPLPSSDHPACQCAEAPIL